MALDDPRVRDGGCQLIATRHIRVCRDPPADAHKHTQLVRPPPDGGVLTLIGWSAIPSPVDSGVPNDIADVLAGALTSAFRVTYPVGPWQSKMPESWTQAGASLMCALTPPDWRARITAAIRREPSTVVLMSTRDAADARLLFDVSDYPWWSQAMPVLLSAPASSPPDIDYTLFIDVLEDAHGAEWANHRPRVETAGVQAVMRAGVDGDLCGLFTRSHRERDQFVGVLGQQARGAGLDLVSLEFGAFMEPD